MHERRSGMLQGHVTTFYILGNEETFGIFKFGNNTQSQIISNATNKVLLLSWLTKTS